MKIWPWLIGGGVGLAVYSYVKSNSHPSESTQEQNGSVPVTIPESERPGSQSTIQRRKGVLSVKLELRVSGAEKMFANKSDIVRDVLKGAKALALTLPEKCPGAPKLMGDPTGSIKDSSNGYIVTINWPAIWGHSGIGPNGAPLPVKPVVRDCVIREIRKQPKVNERFLALSAYRTSAYA